MESVRFFEDTGPDGQRRLLVGIGYSEGPADGGAREAVRVATLADAQAWPAPYAQYYGAFGEPAEGAPRVVSVQELGEASQEEVAGEHNSDEHAEASEHRGSRRR